MKRDSSSKNRKTAPKKKEESPIPMGSLRDQKSNVGSVPKLTLNQVSSKRKIEGNESATRLSPSKL